MENKKDAVNVAPHLHKVILENNKVRILNVVVKPGEKAEMHIHPANVSVVLKGGKMQFKLGDGTSKEVDLKANTASFSDANEHAVENIGTEEIHVIQVELK